jgi:hypothetical protein
MSVRAFVVIALTETSADRLNEAVELLREHLLPVATHVVDDRDLVAAIAKHIAEKNGATE